MRKDQRMSPLTTIIACIAGLGFLYFLSTGPTSRIFGGNAPQWLKKFYAPLTWIYYNTALRGPMEWYTDLWRPKATRPKAFEESK